MDKNEKIIKNYMNCEDNWMMQWDRNVSNKIHKQKLEVIKNREIKQINKSLNPVQQVFRKMKLDRSIEISRENRILYEKLVTISERKHLAKINRKLTNQTPKNLNLKYKKIEADRIIKENFHLVNKLSANNSELSFKKMIKDYEIQSEYRERISRTKFQERIQKAVKIQGKSGYVPQVTSSTLKILSASSVTPTRPTKGVTLLNKQDHPDTAHLEQTSPTELDIIKEKTIE